MLDLTTMSQAEVARKYGVARSSVSDFAIRYKADIASLQVRTAEATEEYRIADKAYRTSVRDGLLHDLLAVKESRKNGGTGIETGLVVRQLKSIGSGRDAEIVEEYKLDPALIELVDKLGRSTAEELGQLPKGDTNIQVNIPVLIRRYEGIDPEELA